MNNPSLLSGKPSHYLQIFLFNFIGLTWSLIKLSSVISQYNINPGDAQKGKGNPPSFHLNAKKYHKVHMFIVPLNPMQP